MDVPHEIAPWFASVLMIVLSMALGVAGYLLKDIRASIKEKSREQDEEIDGIKKDLADFKAQMPREYVLRDDFVRAVAGLDRKIDRVTREISGISRSLNQLIGTRGDCDED